VKTPCVLYINHYDRSNDSASISSYEIIKGLTAVGYKVAVVTHDPYASDKDFASQGVRRVILRFPRTVEESRFLRFLRCTVAYALVFLAGLKIGKKEEIGCIFSQHHNFHLATLTANVLSYFLNVPHVVKIQDGIPLAEPWVDNPLERVYDSYTMRILNGYALRRAKYVLALSRELRSLLMEIFQIPSDRVLIVSNIISTFSVEPSRIRQMRRQLGMRDEKILLFIGVAKQRGIESLIKALPSILSECRATRLLVVGHSSKALKSLAVSLEVEKHVDFIGPIDHSLVPVVISMSDVAIGPLSSDLATYGAVPRKVLEYMAYGKPVISSRGSVSRDLLINGYNGILVKPGDVNELSFAVKSLMKDERLANEIASNARKHILRFYSHDVLVDKLTTLTI